MLSEKDINRELGKGINIYPFNSDNIKENSINLSSSNYCWSMTKGKCYFDTEGQLFTTNNKNNSLKEIQCQKGKNCVKKINNIEYIILLPYSTTLIETKEVIGIDNYIGGTCHSKVGIISQGIGDIETMFGPNFCGHFLISLHNSTNRPKKIEVGKTIVSLVFHYLDTPIDRDNSTIGAHIDKMSSLGIVLSPSETEELTTDWKRNLGDIRSKMKESKEYKDHEKQLKGKNNTDLKKYFNMRNLVIFIVLISILVIMYKICGYMDTKNKNAVWTNRFWDVGCSGIIVMIIQLVFGFIKPKNRQI